MSRTLELTQDDISLCTLLLQHGRVVQITQNDAEFGILLLDLIGLRLRPDEGALGNVSRR
jgi:hypothetical protein